MIKLFQPMEAIKIYLTKILTTSLEKDNKSFQFVLKVVQKFAFLHN